MRPAIPSSQAVDSALQTVAKRLGSARKKINVLAAKEMKADQYESAQKWMEMGRSVADFARRFEAFSKEWKRVVKATRIVASVHDENESGKSSAARADKRATEE